MNTIKKLLLGSAVFLGAGALAGTGWADVFVTATITKDKDKTVTETISKTKTVEISTTTVLTPERGAEAEAIANQRTDQHAVDYDSLSCGDTGGATCEKIKARMLTAFRGNDGLTQSNQDAGNMSNQGNSVSAAFVGVEDDDVPTFAEAQSSASQVTRDNDVLQRSFTLSAASPLKEATIDNSIENNVGITQANQNVGNMNNQLHNVALALGDGAVVALSEADLGQFNLGNHVLEELTAKVGSITGSVNNNTGITNVSQATGNMNNQATVISFSGIADLSGL